MIQPDVLIWIVLWVLSYFCQFHRSGLGLPRTFLSTQTPPPHNLAFFKLLRHASLIPRYFISIVNTLLFLNKWEVLTHFKNCRLSTGVAFSKNPRSSKKTLLFTVCCHLWRKKFNTDASLRKHFDFKHQEGSRAIFELIWHSIWEAKGSLFHLWRERSAWNGLGS